MNNSFAAFRLASPLLVIGKDAQDALDPAGPMEKAGKKIDRAVEDVTK